MTDKALIESTLLALTFSQVVQASVKYMMKGVIKLIMKIQIIQLAFDKLQILNQHF